MKILYFRYLENIRNVFALTLKLSTTDFPNLPRGWGGRGFGCMFTFASYKTKKGVSFYLVDTLHFNRGMHSNKKTCKASSYKNCID